MPPPPGGAAVALLGERLVVPGHGWFREIRMCRLVACMTDACIEVQTGRCPVAASLSVGRRRWQPCCSAGASRNPLLLLLLLEVLAGGSLSGMVLDGDDGRADPSGLAVAGRLPLMAVLETRTVLETTVPVSMAGVGFRLVWTASAFCRSQPPTNALPSS
jgi:hypothetical protein